MGNGWCHGQSKEYIWDSVERGPQAPGAAWWDKDRCFVGSSVDKDMCIRQQTLHGSAPVKWHFQTTHIPKISVVVI